MATNPPVVTITDIDHPDPRIQTHGFRVSDPYIELCWTPIVGPSSVVLLRHLDRRLRSGPQTVPLEELAQSIGLGHGTGANSTIRRTVDRLRRYGFLTVAGSGDGTVRIGIHRQVAAVPAHQLDRLTPWQQQHHRSRLSHHLHDPHHQLHAVPQIHDGIDR